MLPFYWVSEIFQSISRSWAWEVTTCSSLFHIFPLVNHLCISWWHFIHPILPLSRVMKLTAKLAPAYPLQQTSNWGQLWANQSFVTSALPHFKYIHLHWLILCIAKALSISSKTDGQINGQQNLEGSKTMWSILVWKLWGKLQHENKTPLSHACFITETLLWIAVSQLPPLW